MGDQQALSSLYDESSALVYSIALRILGNAADAEEVTLDVYTQVWRSAKEFNLDRGSVNSWLVTMVRSRSIDKLRASKNRVRHEETVDNVPEVSTASPNPEQLSAEGQRSDRVRRALDQLSPAQREVIEMAFYSGYSQSELAEKLGQPLGTVKTRIRLGMLKLREHLEGVAHA